MPLLEFEENCLLRKNPLYLRFDMRLTLRKKLLSTKTEL